MVNNFVSTCRSLILALCCVVVTNAYAALPIQHWQTASGVKVYFVENHDLPIVDVSVSFPAGSAFGTAEKSGTAYLTHSLLALGAQGLSENDISQRLADVGAVLGGSFDMDRAAVSLRTLSSERERTASLDILSRILQQPEFPEAILEREKVRLVSGLKEADTKPEVIADRAFYKLVYANHPYSLRTSGEVDTVPTIKRDDLVNFYQNHYNAKVAIVAIIGDITKAEADRIAQMLTANLPQATTPHREIPPVPPLAAAQITKIPHPASQSHVVAGAPGIRRGDPDYYALYVGNYALGGGGFDSRLLEEIRQKRGLAYSAYSYFYPMKQEGPFEIGLQTKKNQTTDALQVVQKTLREFLAKGPTAKELTQAKQNITGGFPLRIDSNRKILEYLAVIGFYQLPLTYLDDFVGNVSKVTGNDIKRAFAAHVNPDKMVTVVVASSEEATPTK